MERTWKPTTAGILSIVAGVIGLIAGIVVSVVGGMLATFPWYYGDVWTDAISSAPIVSAAGAGLIVLGIIAIVGGIFALQRRVWGLALAGAICALFSPPGSVLGILSIIFVAMGKKEFARS